MKSKLLLSMLSSVVMVGWSHAAYAAPSLLDNPDLKIKVGGMTHAMVIGETVGLDPHFTADLDPTFRRDPRAYLIQDKARLDVTATQGDYTFYLQTSFGPEETTYGSSLPVNSVIDLLDCYAQTSFFGLGRLTLGQFKVPYGREMLVDDHYLLNNDKSLNNLAFQLGRDYGAVLETHLGNLSMTGAVVSLGSRDVPPRYIPEIFGIPGLVARVGYGNENEDVQLLKESRLNLDDTRWGVYANAVYSKDTLIGHSSVFNGRTTDKNLLFNKNYNPWLGDTNPVTKKIIQGEYWEYGLNGGYATPMLGGVVSADGELDYATWSNTNHMLHIAGGEAQLSYTLNPVAVGLRYAILFPDANMAYTVPATTAPVAPASLKNIFGTDAAPIQEITPSIVYYLKGENLKLILDAPMNLNTLTFNEKGNGAYVFNQQPDQVASTAANPNGGISRQFTMQVRLGVQAQF